ncbi:MAG: sigma-70 family RNA polymerase sigma factor [Verrucomicrobia bacterium]|nr:sigma-70 family RNA polymerase sigma factor [Verrucomicrobiota bacterium]
MAEAGLDVAACVERVRGRDEAAARALVEHLHPLVLKIVRSHLPRRVAEEDLAQDIFLKVFERLGQFRGSVPFEHWVARVAVTTCLDQLRAQKRRPELRWADLTETEAEMLDAVITSANVPHPAQALAAKEIVTRLLECLSPQDRLVITLLDLEEMTLAEIRKLTGWNETLIKVRAFRARRKLRKHLEDLEKGRLK